MAHMIEMKNGEASMAYAGQTPWHGLGKEVPADLTPAQMLKAASLDWQVRKVPAYVELNGKRVSIGESALVRDEDDKILDVVTNDWNPVQNQEAFEFFNEFVMEGDMEMNTAGSLRDGQIVWGLAKVKESFELFKGDKIDSYLLFSNFHRFGFATDVRFTPIRVICNNTLTLSLSSSVERMVKISHRTKFDPENVKVMLGVAKTKLNTYKDMAKFLGSKKYSADAMIQYFNKVFPRTSSNDKTADTLSRNANMALGQVEVQPGAEYARGTFWQLFNAVTYVTDHKLGRSADTRLASAWYGYNRNLKTKALETAVEMANAA